MRVARISCFAFSLALAGSLPVRPDFHLEVECSLTPEKFAAGLISPVRPVDSDGDGDLDDWIINNHFGEISDCNDVVLPCGSLWHHTGEDHLVNRRSSESQDREIYAMDNGIVVFSAMQNELGGLVLIKHVAPPTTRFEIPAYSETLEYEQDKRVTISYPREFTTEIVTYYLHLGDVYVSQGDSVSRGQAIGRTYTSVEQVQRGYVYVPHLHLEVWRGCMTNDNEGYEKFGTSEFQDAVTNQIVAPTALLDANAADQELVRIVPVQLPPSGNLQIMGAEFGKSPGVVWISGEILFSDSPQIWPISVDPANWVDSEIRLNLFQGPLTSPLYLISPLLFEVRRADGEREGAFFYPFKDVKSEQWFSGSVIRLWKDGLIVGSGEIARFLPDELIKRSEFVKLLVQSVCPDGSGPCGQAMDAPGYTDVKPEHWFYEPVRIAWNLGWLDRTQAQFRPHDPIARAEVAKIVAIAAGTPLRTPADNPYADVHATDWFAPYVLGLTDAGVLNGYSDRTFHPGASITRAEAARLIDHARLYLGF